MSAITGNSQLEQSNEVRLHPLISELLRPRAEFQGENAQAD